MGLADLQGPQPLDETDYEDTIVRTFRASAAAWFLGQIARKFPGA